MIRVKKIESIEKLNRFKTMYVKQATAPLDGMWLCGFVPMARHFGVYDEDNLRGYFCINENGYLLQYFLEERFGTESEEHFKTLLETQNSETGNIKGAFCSTAEPGFLSLCLDNFRTNRVNTLMYQYNSSLAQVDKRVDLKLLKDDNLQDAIAFDHKAIGAPVDWLNSYLSNLINRQELFAVIQDRKIIAVGECRGYDEYQTDYADLGVIVAPDERSKGIATNVLVTLCDIAKKRKLIPICSTEVTNKGARKAIVRAGFYSNNRIIQFDKRVKDES